MQSALVSIRSLPPNKQNAGELLPFDFLKVGLAATFLVVVGSLAHPQSPDFER